MAERIVVTGVGIISALGTGKAAHIAALTGSQTGVKHAKHLQSVHTSEFLLGEVNESNDELSLLLNLPAGENGYTRTTLLSLTAMGDLLKDIDLQILRGAPLALVNANTVGGMDKMEDIYMDLLGADVAASKLQYISTLDCAESTETIAACYGLKPLIATISTACSSSANSLMLGARLIKQGVVTRAICGGSDALSRFTLNGFNSLKNLDRQWCRPFDQDRDGLNLGEAAGYCLLETESAARERGAGILAILSGYANTNDAHHPTAPSPDGKGAGNTMRQALEMAALQPGDIGYINAHGTATLNNDLAEGLAIQYIFGAKPPPFSSTKPFTGHTLAAAGVIEAIFSIWAMEQNMVWPNLNFRAKMDELAIIPALSAMPAPLQHVLSNSFGFGGSNVSLLFSKA